MRRLILCALAALLSVAAQTGGQQPSCAAGDPVVWANSSSKVYHLQGDKYYGNTKHGQYLCQSKANAAGYHASKSGKAASGSATGAASPLPAASPSAKHHHHKGTPAAGASPLPGASPSAKHHRHKGTPAAGASPLPGASPSAKHHHHKASASPAPSAT
jgi:hypothetical protein